MKKSKAILFDVDGTLLDTWDFVVKAFQYTLSVHGHPDTSIERIRLVLGFVLEECYIKLYPGMDPQVLCQTHRQFQKDNFSRFKTFPNTLGTLINLKADGFILAAVSNRLKKSLNHSLRMTKLSRHFDLVLSAEDVPNPKPHPDHLLLALEHLKIKPQKGYMVGDTKQDILAGKNAGVKTVGVTYGFAGVNIKDLKPDYVIDDIRKLLDIVRRK